MEMTAEISWVPGAKKNGRIGSFVCITRRLNSKPSYPNPCQHTWNSQTVVPDPVLLNFSVWLGTSTYIQHGMGAAWQKSKLVNTGFLASTSSQVDWSPLLLSQQPQVLFSAFPKVYFNVAEIYRRRCLEASGQMLENVDRTHRVLTSGKLVLRKIT